MESGKFNSVCHKFKEIKNEIKLSMKDISRNKLNKNKTQHYLTLKQSLPKTKKSSKEKVRLNHLLEQIENGDLFFSNDNIIANIKIESLDSLSKRVSTLSNENCNSFISKKKYKTNSKSVKQRKNNRQKNIPNKNKIEDLSNLYSNHNTLELNCNKLTYIIGNNKKKQIYKKKSLKRDVNSNKSKNICIKNIEQFINKPNLLRKNLKKKILLTPINSKSKISMHNQKIISSTDLNCFKSNNSNDTTILSTTTQIRGRSMPTINSKKNQIHLRLPNKSIIKNPDKTILELQKIFGEKIKLSEEIYQTMTDLDKKNCINFLLEAVKGMNNVNKMNKTKSEGFKQIIQTKDLEIKNLKNEIKELKKENNKLNKIIKNNIQLNKKINQNLENLKIQLEKEKIKNKNLIKIGKSTSKIKMAYSNKYKNINSSITKNGIIKENNCQNKIIKGRGSFRRQKNKKSFDRKLNILENEMNENNIYEKIDVNITWQNIEDNKTDISPDSRISNSPKRNNIN